EVSDNFANTADDHQVDSRTGVILGTVYRLDKEQSFVSLANTVRAFYAAREATSQFGFANLLLRAGHQLTPSVFLGVSDSFFRDDGTAQGQDAAFALARAQQRFIRNNFSPQVRYDLSPLTSIFLNYQNTIVVDENGPSDTSITHGVSPGIRHQFNP